LSTLYPRPRPTTGQVADRHPSTALHAARGRRLRVPAFLLVWAATALSAVPAFSEVRAGSFTSPALGREVSYVVDLPPSYEASPQRRYPVVYALHGLFEGPAFWERRGLAAIVAALREKGAIPEFLVVAVDGGNSFFANGRAGRFEDLFTKDLIEHVEKTYRVKPARSGRGLLGISMGGYAALHAAFERKGLYAAVATHSAMLLEQVPSAAQGAGRWHMAAFNAVFGDPIDVALWNAYDPLARARQAEAKGLPALYFDCGSEDRFGLAGGARKLHAILDERRVPHSFELAPGDHGYEFVRGRLEKSLRFLAQHLEQ
jgi:S-formylglutathione hydrolase FrmB